MGTPKSSRRKWRVWLLASIAMAVAAASSAAVAQADIVEQMLSSPDPADQKFVNQQCDEASKGDKTKRENELAHIAGPEMAEFAKLARKAQSDYKFQSGKIDDYGKILNRHVAQRLKMDTPPTGVTYSEEQKRLLESQIETDADQVERALKEREEAKARADTDENFLKMDQEIADCIKARLAALNKAPATAPGLAHAAPTAPIRSGNTWACARDRVEYNEGGKVLPSGSSNDLVVGDTTVAVPAYTDRSGSYYPAARITFTPPKPRYVVGETVVLELNVEGGHGKDLSPGNPGFSQGDAMWFAKEIGGSNVMGAVDADERGATCGDSGHESCGDTRQTKVSFPFQPKAQQGVDVVGGIPIPPQKHPPGDVGLALWASGAGRVATIFWICRPQ